jgi:hypothetical protein
MGGKGDFVWEIGFVRCPGSLGDRLRYRRSNMVFLATFVWENWVVRTKALQETKALQPTTREGCGQPLAVAATLKPTCSVYPVLSGNVHIIQQHNSESRYNTYLGGYSGNTSC